MALIAKTRVISGSGTARKEFAPGETVEGLSPHDIEQLKRAGAIVDTDDETRAARAQARAEADGNRAFDKERQAVLAAKESVKVAPNEGAESASETAADDAAHASAQDSAALADGATVAAGDVVSQPDAAADANKSARGRKTSAK